MKNRYIFLTIFILFIYVFLGLHFIVSNTSQVVPAGFHISLAKVQTTDQSTKDFPRQDEIINCLAMDTGISGTADKGFPFATTELVNPCLGYQQADSADLAQSLNRIYLFVMTILFAGLEYFSFKKASAKNKNNSL